MFGLVMAIFVCFRPAHSCIDDNHGHALLEGRSPYWE